MATIEGPWNDINKPFCAPYWDYSKPDRPSGLFEAATVEEIIDFYFANPQLEFCILLYKGMYIAAAFEDHFDEDGNLGIEGEVLRNGKMRRKFRNLLNRIFENEKNDE